MGEEYDYKLQLLVVGDSKVGKTCLCQRFSEDEFLEQHKETVGVDYTFHTIMMQDKKVKLQIFSASGSERFTSVSYAYYKRSDGIIIVYDVTNQESFTHLRNFILAVNTHCSDDTKTILVGNKSDLNDDRVISKATAKEYADELEMSLIETSAKDSTNVEEAFSTLVFEILKERNKDTTVKINELTPVNSLTHQTNKQTTINQESKGEQKVQQSCSCCII